VGTALPVEGTFTGLCIQSGKELRCDDAENDARVDKAAIRALGIRSMVVIPIKEEGRVVGVLAVFAPTAHAFSITHVVVLKTMADQIAAYLHRTQRDQAYSPEPLPPPLTRRQLPVVPKVEPVRATTFTEQIHPARFSQDKATNSHDEQKESKADFRRGFSALDAAAARENRLGKNVLMLGAAAVLVIAVAIELSFVLRRPDAVPQPALEARSSPGTPAAPAASSANAQPSPNNTPAALPPEYHELRPKREEARPKREETVELLPYPSRISLPQLANSARVGDPALPAGARDNSAPTSDAPAISLGNLPASGSLSNLASPVSHPPNPRLLTQSEFEPVTAIKKVPPVYPLVAKQYKLSGNVVVQGTVSRNGRISDLQLISGSPLFRDAAFAAVKQWVFKPAKLDGQAIEQPTRIRLYFDVP
jgi:TonB family protein